MGPRNRELRHAKRRALIVSLGGKCVCCGSESKLQFDHKIARSRGGIRLQLSLVEMNPNEFQLLCRDCNSWKNTGPRCPCRWWDEVDPNWRTAKPPDLRRITNGEALRKRWASVSPEERKANIRKANEALTPEILLARNRKIVATRRTTDRVRVAAIANVEKARAALTPEIVLARNRKIVLTRRKAA